MGILDNYEAADQAFHTKAVLTQDNATLLEHLHGLSNQNNINEGTQHRDIIRGITINNILLQRHIDSLQKHITDLNADNNKLQKLVVALTVASLVGTAAQIWFAYKADKKAEQVSTPTASQQQMPKVQSESPTQPVAPSSGQATPKKP